MRYCFFEMELEIELREGTGGANVVKIIKAGLCPVWVLACLSTRALCFIKKKNIHHHPAIGIGIRWYTVYLFS